MTPYLVTGLPRSRTAWMAEWLPNCVHEPVIDLDAIDDLRGVYAKHQGVSDSGLGFWLDWILREIKPRTLIIERDIAEVERSLAELCPQMPATNLCQLLRAELDKHKAHPLVMVVPFHALSHPITMRKVWWHLTGNHNPFDEGRYDRMNKMNIQVDPERAIELVKSRKVGIMNEIAPLIRHREV